MPSLDPSRKNKNDKQASTQAKKSFDTILVDGIMETVGRRKVGNESDTFQMGRRNVQSTRQHCTLSADEFLQQRELQ